MKKCSASHVWAVFYLNPETENDREIMYSDHSIVWGTEKKRLESIRHICLSIKPHTFQSAPRGMASSPPCAASLALALYSLSVILSFPWWEMILSLCSCPDALSTQGLVDLWVIFLTH